MNKELNRVNENLIKILEEKIIILEEVSKSKDLINEELTKQLNLSVVGNCAYLVQDKNTLINHGLFTSEEKANRYIGGNTKYTIQKCDIA